jgi:hypothetical protein
MSSKIRNVALLFPALALATLAYAQPGIKISQVDSSGQVTHSTFDPSSGPVAKAPTPGPNGTFKYWDGLSATNFYNQANFIAAPPNPQIAVGPDDILTIVNRTIARYANPNAAGNLGATNPYANPATHQVFLDAWLGSTTAGLCPAQGQFGTCVLDNASIRYDQLQGRFVVLMTVTDLEFHLSNWVLLVSRWANFACSTTGGGPASACPFTSDIFTPPIVNVQLNGTGLAEGGPATGGLNGNWVGYVIPINVTIATGGIVTSPPTAGAPFCAGTTAAVGGSPATAPPGGGTASWNGGPGNPPLTPTTGCTNYYPTGARMGIDNDNIILTAPVLDQTQTVFGPSGGAGLPGGAYAGTRVTTVPKLVVYNGTALALSAGPFSLGGAVPLITLGAVNLSDDTATGTLVGATGAISGAINPIPGVVGPNQNPNLFGGYEALNLGQPGPTSNILPIFWEPDNVRGRALASFDSQVGITSIGGFPGTNVQGVITPLDYLVGIQTSGSPGGVQLGSATPGTNFWVQSIVFSCPAAAIFSAPAGVTFCGTAGAGGTQVPDFPQLGVLNAPIAGVNQLPRTNANAIGYYGDPQLVGQGAATSTPAPTVGPVGLAGPTGFYGGTPRLYVGDNRPHQVVFREGLLYVARVAMPMDLNQNVLATSTVVYDIIKQAGPACAANGALGLGGPGPFCTAPSASLCPTATAPGCSASPYSPNGVTIPNPVTILETQWYNGTTPSPCQSTGGYGGPVSGAGNTPGNPFQPICDANGFGFYAPMFDTPASVIGGLATSSQQPISPISLFPWLEKLFVGMTTGGPANLAATFGTNNPSLWDFRPGDDAYDSSLTVIDPVNGKHKSTTNDPFFCNVINNGNANNPLFVIQPNPYTGTPAARCPVIPFGTRGGASTDPNDGSLWLYGAFAKKRFAQINAGPGVWGTSVANYALDFPATDAYNNDNSYFSDVQPGTNGFFTWIQIAKNVGIATAKTGACANTWSAATTYNVGDRVFFNGTLYASAQSSNTGHQPDTSPTFWQVVSQPIIPPGVGNNAGGTTSGPAQTCFLFGPTDFVTRSEMAKWIVLAQMDEAQVTLYLNATGGSPVGNSNLGSSFADDLTDVNIRYIETMYRRGYTKGCPSTADVLRKYCPTDLVTRGQMAVFVIRAKMNNVFPTTLSGIPLTGIYGDNFGTFLGVNPNGVAPGPNGTCLGATGCATGQYFQDEPTSDGFFLYIQKMRELRITNGTGTSAACPAGPCYSPLQNITRQELATFIVRAFFL